MFSKATAILFIAIAQYAIVAASERPNIVFAIADDASWRHFGAYGATWIDTPAFDRIADEGLLFKNAYTPNAKCGPSRSSILTGRNSWQLEELANHWVDYPAGKYQTYQETLAANGYHTGFTGKPWSPGDPGALPDGSRRPLVGKAYNQAKAAPPAALISDTDYAENFRLFLADRKPGQPFSFWYGGHEPHRAYEYGAGIKYGGKSLDDIPEIPRFWPDNEKVRTDMLDYAFEIEHFDRHLGRILKVLEDAGELENTLIVVTSDNGMPFPRVKGQEYEYATHMPLAILWPGGIKRPGRVIDDYVSFIDFAPTFLEIAQINGENEGMAPITGQSLVPLFHSLRSGQVDPNRDYTLLGQERHDVGRPDDVGYPIRGIVKDGYMYLANLKPERWPAGNPITGYMNIDTSPTKTEVLATAGQPQKEQFWQWNVGKRPEEEFYDVRRDPECIHDLADSPAHRERKVSMRRQLLAELERQQDPRAFGRGDEFDQYPFGRKGMQNFYHKLLTGTLTDMGWHNPEDAQPEFEDQDQAYPDRSKAEQPKR